MRINKITYLMIVLMLACTAGFAQRSAVIFSPIASSSTGVTISSGAFSNSGKGGCVVSATGLSALTIANNGKGSFGASCSEIPPVANVAAFSLAMNVFPNPTSGITTIKCEGTFDANLSCQIRIMSIDGRMMMSQMVNMKEVKAGYVVNVAAYAAGTYVVVVDFMSQRYSMKLLKA